MLHVSIGKKYAKPIYLRVLPPLRDEELPPEREPPADMPPDERMVLDDDERTLLGADERIVLDEEERTELLPAREVVVVERTVDEERDGVVEVLTLLLRVALVRVGVAAVR